MRYKIEYLREATEEDSVCFAEEAPGLSLTLAVNLAQMAGPSLSRVVGANAFQIRDLERAGQIVALDLFDRPPLLN